MPNYRLEINYLITGTPRARLVERFRRLLPGSTWFDPGEQPPVGEGRYFLDFIDENAARIAAENIELELGMHSSIRELTDDERKTYHALEWF